MTTDRTLQGVTVEQGQMDSGLGWAELGQGLEDLVGHTSVQCG